MAVKKSLESFRDSIEDYGKQITTHESLMESIRKLPGMYIGETGTRGYITLIREATQNAFDEMVKPDSPCDMVSVVFDQRSLLYAVEDNGRGLPFDDIERIMTKPHTSSNFVRKKGVYPSGMHGTGIKCVNAMSELLVVESYNHFTKETMHVEFRDGVLQMQQKIPNKDGKQGTLISFTPSVEAMGRMLVTTDMVRDYIKTASSLNPIGSVIHYKLIDLDGVVETGTFVNKNGIDDFYDPSGQIAQPIRLTSDDGEFMFDIIIGWTTDTREPYIRSFANKCPTYTGCHINGTDAAICSWFQKYMNNVYLVKANSNANRKTELKCSFADIRVGRNIILNCACMNPQFNGQAKTDFTTNGFEDYLKEHIPQMLDEWALKNSQKLTKICDYFKKIIQIRINSDKEIKSIKVKNPGLDSLPSKFVKESFTRAQLRAAKLENEIMLVEGDSAGGSIRNSRDHRFQAYLPLKGKIPNANRTTVKAMLSNAEIGGFIKCLGCEFGASFNMDKLRYDKIIIFTDADSDGDHIAALIIRFMIVFFPQLIEAGKLYRIIPPLYGIRGKKDTIFLRDNEAVIRHLQKEFVKKYTICHADGTPLTKEQLVKLLMLNEDYVYYMDKLCSSISCTGVEELVEEVLNLMLKGITSVDAMRKAIREKYTFSDVEIVKNSKNKELLKISTTYGKRRNIIFIDDVFMSQAAPIVDILRKNKEFEFIMNGEKVALIKVVQAYDNFKPEMVRFKGLGEMSGKDIAKACLNPENRHLVRYTMESAREASKAIQYFDENTGQILRAMRIKRSDLE